MDWGKVLEQHGFATVVALIFIYLFVKDKIHNKQVIKELSEKVDDLQRWRAENLSTSLKEEKDKTFILSKLIDKNISVLERIEKKILN